MGDIGRYVLRPLLGGVEGYDPDRAFVLAVKQISDHRFQIGGFDIGFPVGPSVAAKSSTTR
jgi:hypothetical protein